MINTCFSNNKSFSHYNINLTLTKVNDKPYFDNIFLEFDEDEYFTFNLEGEDVEDDTLTFEIIKLPTRLDSILPVINGNETILFEYGEIPKLSILPQRDYNGLDSLI